jgi:UBX domain-containing protein 1/4
LHSEHTDFSESTEEIPQLSKEEQKAKLEELRKAAAERRAKQALIDKEEAKKNEV